MLQLSAFLFKNVFAYLYIPFAPEQPSHFKVCSRKLGASAAFLRDALFCIEIAFEDTAKGQRPSLAVTKNPATIRNSTARSWSQKLGVGP